MELAKKIESLLIATTPSVGFPCKTGQKLPFRKIKKIMIGSRKCGSEIYLTEPSGRDPPPPLYRLLPTNDVDPDKIFSIHSGYGL
jgi:hypothetical protein